MPYKDIVQAVTTSVFAGASLTTGFQKFNATPLPSVFLLIVTNDTDQVIYISYDGIHTNDVIISDQQITRYFQTNSAPNNQIAMLPNNQTVWIACPGGTASGTVYLSAYYIPKA